MVFASCYAPRRFIIRSGRVLRPCVKKGTVPLAESVFHQTPVVPSGAAFYPVTDTGPARKYAFLVVPGFTLLAFSSAVDPLRIANQLAQKPLYHWRTFSEDGQPVPSSSGIPIVVDSEITQLDRDTTLLVCSGNHATAIAGPKGLAALQRHSRFGGTVGGICTGAMSLAKAGLLHDTRFTLHWENQPGFRETFPNLTPTERQYEMDGRVMTCGGGAAATDMMLSIITRDHGPHFSAIVSEKCLRHVMTGTERSQRSAIGAIIQSRNPGLISIVGLMLENLEHPLPMEDLAASAGYSRRQIERTFKASLGMTPASYYRKLRLDHARALLATTDMSLTEISTACGFESVSHFSKVFKSQFGCVPSKHNSRQVVREAGRELGRELVR